MSSRLELHEILCGILGSRNCYFQPPVSVKMSYPAIVYSLSSLRRNHADDSIYKQMRAYEIIVIDYDPESVIAEKVSHLQYCSLDRPPYPSDNLNHFVFTLYYKN